jgi:DNA-binding NtrC family response regulator
LNVTDIASSEKETCLMSSSVTNQSPEVLIPRLQVHAQALAATNGNVTAAAKKLGISRRTLHRKINEMNAAKSQAQSASEKTN